MEQSTVTVYVDWTEKQGRTLHGLMIFSLPRELDEKLTGAGREPQFRLTVSTRGRNVTALNDYSGEAFTARGPVRDVAAAAAEWLGLQAPLVIRQDSEYTR